MHVHWIPSQLLVGMLGAAPADQRFCMALEVSVKRLAFHCGIPEQNIGASLLFDFPFPRTPHENAGSGPWDLIF